MPEKRAKRIRVTITVVEILVLMTVGGGVAFLLAGRSLVVSMIATLVACMLVIGFSTWVKQKYPHIFVKQCSEKPVEVSRAKKVLTAMLQGATGFCIAYGLVGAIVSLIQGHEGSYALYIGAVLLGVAVIVVMTTVPAVQDAEFKAEMAIVKKDMRYYEKDERYIAITYKAGYYTLWLTLSALLVFGAALVAFEVESASTVLWGMLGIIAGSAMLWIVLFAVYDEDKTGNEKRYKTSVRSSIITFVISLVPVGMMAARWIAVGLNNIGRGFFVAFVVVSLVFLSDIIMRVRLEKNG